jgi:hypothetical protein
MALQPYPAFVGGNNASQSPIADVSSLINWYVELFPQDGAKSKAALYPIPGVQRFGRSTQSGGRAMYSTAAVNGRVFGVIGLRLVEINIAGAVTERGTVALDANPATICTNGDGGGQLLITAGSNGYNYDLATNTLSVIATLTGKATMGGFAYGYGLVFDKATATVYLSDLFDFTVFDPTQFFQRTIGSDAWNAMCVTSWGQIFLPGTKTRDYWYNAGTFPIPFAPAQSGLQADGIGATFSVKECAGSLAWLSTNADGGYEVMAAQGYRGQKISTEAVEYSISRMTRIDDATAESYKDQGHAFYLLKFPTAGITWVYDFATSIWHVRGTWQPTTAEYQAWRPTFHCFAFGKHLWCDSNSGAIYESDISFTKDVYNDAETEQLVIRRVRTAPSICRGHQMMDFGRFELLMQTGEGNTVDPGMVPVVTKQSSNDGGRTWGTERTCSAGRKGEYLKRVYWEQNGSAIDRSERVICSDPINNWRIIDAFYDISGEFGAAA